MSQASKQGINKNINWPNAKGGGHEGISSRTAWYNEPTSAFLHFISIQDCGDTEEMDQDEDTVMRDSGSSTNMPSSSTAAAAATTAFTRPNGDGLQPATLLGMPKLPSSLMSPPAAIPMPMSVGVATEITGLTKSIEDEGLHTMMIKSSEESDSIQEENSDWSVEDPSAAASAVGLPVASLATGLCYDIRMRYHCEVRPAAEVHPEDPRRIYYIYKEICRAGLIEDLDIVPAPRMLAPMPLKRIDVRNATKEEVQLVHTDEHYQFVSDTQSMFSSRNI